MNPKLRLFWLGLFLLVSSWQFLVPVFTPTASIGLPMLLLGAFFIALSLPDAAPPPRRGSLISYSLAGLAIAALAPYPHCLGGFLLLGGVVCMWVRPAGSKSYAFGFGLQLSGIIVVIQSFCLPVLMSIGSSFHDLPFLSPFVSALFQFLGYSAYSENSSVFVQTDRGIQEFAISAEYFGWFFLFNAVAGVFLWQMLGPFKNRFRTSLVFLATALVYAVGRYLLLAVLYLDLRVFSVFWNPWLVGLSFLPLFLWLVGFWNKLELSTPSLAVAPEPLPLRLQSFAATGTFVALLLLVGAWGWEEPGQVKPGRMLIDEAHSDWELMNRKYDTEWYGEESGYNYYCLSQFLGHYYRVRNNGAKITPALLADCDILVIKTPTKPFTPDEIDAIENFVARGGGLLLIGDHTNVFGTSTYLNPIVRRFGLHYNPDATYDLATGGLSFYKRPRLMPHPIVQWLPPFLFGTSCTLDIPWGAAVPMNGYALRVGGHDYSTPTFFTSKTDGPEIGFGLFPQLAAVKFKRGRVAAFTDSTVFSNFWMFVPGKPELLLGCTEWLNRQNLHPVFPFMFYGLGFLLGAWAFFCIRQRMVGSFPVIFAAGCLGFFAGAYSTAALNRLHYPPPSPHTPCRTICFDQQYSHFELPDQKLILEPRLDFHTLYAWVQRVGYVPRVSACLSQAANRNDGLVLLNPAGSASGSDIRRLKEYVEKGGVLYVFDSPANTNSSANEFLSAFGVRINNEVLPSQTVSNVTGVVALNQSIRTVQGGTGTLFTTNHLPVLSIKRQGKGAVIAAGNSELFAVASLGTVNRVPDAEQKRLYETIFELYRQIEVGAAVQTPSH